MSDQTDETRVPEEPTGETAPAAEPAVAHKGFLGKLDAFFGITKSGSSFRIEIVAGLTTFMAMVYILMVNAGFFSAVIPYGAAYIATAIGAVVGTLLMALLAKMPLAQASGMGINAFIVFSLIGKIEGLTYANSMVFVLLNGVIFLILTATGLRKKIFEAIPTAVRHAIPVGIGLFIAFIGMQNANIIVASDTLVSFASFNVLPSAGNSYLGIIVPFVAIVGVLAVAVMSKKKVKGAILWGILGSAILYYALAGLGCSWNAEGCKEVFTSLSFSNPFAAFKDWGVHSLGQVFVKGFDFSGYLAVEGQNGGTLALVLFTSALSLCMINLFDTIGTLYGACARGDLLDESGTPVNMKKMMLADAIATCTAAVAGTSTVTTFVESSSGVAAGGKTGLTALTTAILFLLAMFLSPIAQLIPGCATASALIWVGVLMMTSVTKIDWSDPVEAIVAFLTFIVMLLGYSILKGIGVGILAFVVVKLCTGKVKEISVPTYVIGALFLATFLLT